MTGLMLAARICDVLALAGTVAWLADYARSRPWRNPLSANLAAKTLIIAAFCALTAVGLFTRLNRHNTVIIAWCQVILLGSVGPVMVHRMWAFRRLGVTRECPRGHVVSAAARFCPECGARMPGSAGPADRRQP